MRSIRSVSVYALSAFLVLFSVDEAHALKKSGGKGLFGGGSISVGLGLGINTADQTGMNSLITGAKNTAASTASSMGSATEYMAQATFRFSNNYIALQLRPALFQQNSSGSGIDGTHEYNLNGYTIFPLVRFIPLSNDLIDFFLQTGIGYGNLSGHVKNGGREVNFSGSSFGLQVGLGAEFCFFPNHCFGVEGNYRYLPIQRNIASSGTGPANLPHGTTQAQVDKELEDSNGNDVATTLSGVSGMLTYIFNF